MSFHSNDPFKTAPKETTLSYEHETYIKICRTCCSEKMHPLPDHTSRHTCKGSYQMVSEHLLNNCPVLTQLTHIMKF